MTCRFLIGDVFERLAEIPDESVDFLLCSPPFLALRSYLPADHPDKAQEIGSEGTPAAFLDVLLALTVEWGRVLTRHGSIAIELGDTYSDRRVDGWPLDKSLAFIPQLYGACLAYGRNLLTGEPSPAGMWRVRTVKPWIRSNPPVGALGDKERPATSYVIVATRTRDRYFDLDAVRTPHGDNAMTYDRRARAIDKADQGMNAGRTADVHPAGAPPRDWYHEADAVLDACLDDMARQAGKPHSHGAGRKRESKDDGGWSTLDALPDTQTGARGVHLRRALERAGILRTLEALDVSPKGYRGAHYAVWPPELVRLLVAEMAPRRVCTTCGQPSRRLTETSQQDTGRTTNGSKNVGRKHETATGYAKRTEAAVTTVGWSDCGHGTWRPGLVLDPFVGSGTTLAVCSGMGRDSIGIDLDERNADLARERVGMFLEVG